MGEVTWKCIQACFSFSPFKSNLSQLNFSYSPVPLNLHMAHSSLSIWRHNWRSQPWLKSVTLEINPSIYTYTVCPHHIICCKANTLWSKHNPSAVWKQYKIYNSSVWQQHSVIFIMWTDIYPAVVRKASRAGLFRLTASISCRKCSIACRMQSPRQTESVDWKVRLIMPWNVSPILNCIPKYASWLWTCIQVAYIETVLNIAGNQYRVNWVLDVRGARLCGWWLAN